MSSDSDNDQCQPLRQALEELESSVGVLQGQPDADPREIRSLISEVRRLRAELAEFLRSDGLETDRMLTGTCTANDGANYYLRQIGQTVWWAGLSTESLRGEDDFQLGLSFTNVFRGTIQDNLLTGEWVYVPRGVILQSDTLKLRIEGPSQMRREDETGNFGGSLWTRTNFSPPLDLRARFDCVLRNDSFPGPPVTGTLREHLKAYKDPVVVTGNVLIDLVANCPPRASRRYANFMCNEDDDFDPDRFDGDLFFFLLIEREGLETQLNSPADALFNDPNHIRRKLDRINSRGEIPEVRGFRNLVHPEIIMYGRSAGKTNCAGNVIPLLPGWMESGANKCAVQCVPD